MNLSVRRSRYYCLVSILVLALAATAASLVLARPRDMPRDLVPGMMTTERTPLFPATSSFVNPETTYFGGTVWAADSMRWEAIEGGTWTFESGVGSHFQHLPDTHKDQAFHAQMEGWPGVDLEGPRPGFFRRLSTQDFIAEGVAACVGSSAGLGGECSFWAGVLPSEADSLWYAAGMGYGNDWSICIEKTFQYNGSGSVSLQYDYSVNVEPSYDWVELQVDTTGIGNISAGAVHTGTDSGSALTVLTPGTHLPVTSSPFVVRFCLNTDAGYSDEDGIYPTTCGAFAVDNISVQGGGISDSSTFELGEDGWSVAPFGYPTALRDFPGDWSRLMHVADLPSPPDSLGDCDFGDSVLVFFDPAIQGHPDGQYNIAISPWIDLKRAGIADSSDKFLELGGYFNLPLADRIYVVIFAQWFPGDTCSVTGAPLPSELTRIGWYRFWSDGPTCATSALPIRVALGDTVPPTVGEMRVGLGVGNLCAYYSGCSELSNTTPWFDGIRVGVVTEGSAVGIPDDPFIPRQAILSPPTPNPVRGLQVGSISFAVPYDQHTRIDVFDIAGRKVATIFDGTATKGWNEAHWSGEDDRGRLVSRGIYFYRLVTDDAVVSRKLVRL